MAQIRKRGGGFGFLLLEVAFELFDTQLRVGRVADFELFDFGFEQRHFIGGVLDSPHKLFPTGKIKRDGAQGAR